MTAVTDRPTLGEYVTLADLYPSPLNPRKHLNPEKFEELVASVKAKGILEPLLVREGVNDRFEIIAGERRFKAAQQVGLDALPIVIRTLTDAEALEIMVIENGQRDGLHPLEECEGFRRLMAQDRAYTPEAIAAKVGKSKRYVEQRLQMASLDPAVKTAFLNDEITAGHAELLMRLTPEDQSKAFKACFDHLFGEDKENGVISVRALRTWIEDHIRLPLVADAPELQAFPELQQVIAASSSDQPLSLVQVSSHWNQAPKGVLSRDSYRTVTKKSEHCSSTERAVVVIGEDRGHLLDICRDKKCKKHWQQATYGTPSPKPSTSTKKSPQAVAAEKKAAEKQKAERARAELRDKVMTRAVALFEKRLPKAVPLTPAAVELLLFQSGSTTLRGLLIDSVGERLRYDIFGEKEYQQAAKMLKPFGVDVVVIERELAPAPKAAAAKKAAKK